MTVRPERRVRHLAVWALVLAAAAAAMATLRLDWPAWLLAGTTALLAVGKDVVVSVFTKVLSSAETEDPTRERDRMRTRGVRVSDADPQLLGIRAAMPRAQAPGRGKDSRVTLPTYVRREAHSLLSDHIREAMAGGGFVLLVGRSGTGKSRLAFEVLRELVGQWWLRAPADIAHLRALVKNPRLLRKTVVWLDDIRRYLDGSTGLTRSLVRELAHSGQRVLIVGMMWTKDYDELTRPPDLGAFDLYWHERDLLAGGRVVRVPDHLTPTELSEARRIAREDERIADALKVGDFSLPQVLALAPELLHRWLHAPDNHSRAVISAAVDASRIGAREPLTKAFLEEAASGYLTIDEQAHPHWFRHALRHATSPVQGVAAPLQSDPRKKTFIAADYLRHYGTTIQKAPPRPVWSAAAAHITSASDLYQIGRNAYSRDFDGEAERIWTAAHRLGDSRSTVRLAELLVELHRRAEAEKVLREAVDTGEPSVRELLGDLLIDDDRVTEALRLWRDGVAAGDHQSYRRLAAELVKLGRIDDAIALWRDAIALGISEGYSKLAALLEIHGAPSDAEALWEQAAANGHPSSLRHLAALLSRRNRGSEAEAILTAAITAGDVDARVQLADLHVGLGRPDLAETLLREGIRAGESVSRHQLAALLVTLARPDEAKEMLDAADREDYKSRQRLIDMLIDEGHLSELSQAETLCREGLAAGDLSLRIRLCDILVALHRPDEADEEWLHAIDEGDPSAHWRRASWLIGLDRVAEAKQVLLQAMRAGDTRARERLDELQPDGRRLGRGLVPPERHPY